MIEKTVMDRNTKFEKASEDFKYAASVALFGMQLRNSEFINSFETNDVITMAEAGKGTDKDGYRSEFIRLVKSYK
jgi:Ca-activated chloride channel family protein